MEAHLNAFLDEIYEFNSRDQVSFLSYLQYWEQKGKDQKIVIPEGTNAVKIMTIHKAKGLEFPVVVLPFTSEELVSSQIRKVWYPINNHLTYAFLITSRTLTSHHTHTLGTLNTKHTDTLISNKNGITSNLYDFSLVSFAKMTLLVRAPLNFRMDL